MLEMGQDKKRMAAFNLCVAAIVPMFFMFMGGDRMPPYVIPFLLLLIPFGFLVTFLNTDMALIVLIFSMLLSPEIKLAEVPQRAVVVRMDDILIIVIFFSWLAKVAVNKELGPLKNTSLNAPIGVYILICLIANGLGVLTGKIGALKSSFYILKYFEYFMLYFMVSNNVRDKKQVKTFITAMIITCILTCIYALATSGALGRATAPFEGSDEPNTLGGYLLLILSVVMGIFLYTRSKTWQIVCASSALLMFATLLKTLSRGSYAGFIVAYLVLIILTKKRKVMAVAGLVLVAGSVYLFLPQIVSGAAERVAYTFQEGQQEYRPLGREVSLDASAAARIDKWKDIFELWRLSPILGYGITGVGFVDSQFPLVLGETGIFGLVLFIWLLVMIFLCGLRALQGAEEDWEHGLALGFLAGFIGLIAHSFSAATFIIVRVMEPFWFLAAIIAVLPTLSHQGEPELAEAYT